MLTRSFSYGVTALLQSLDCLRGGSSLTAAGVVNLLVLLTQRRKRDRVWFGNLQLQCQSVCDWPVDWSVQSVRTTVLTPNLVCVMSPLMGCSCWVGGYNETESHYAFYNCTMRASGTVPTSGLSNLQ